MARKKHQHYTEEFRKKGVCISQVFTDENRSVIELKYDIKNHHLVP